LPPSVSQMFENVGALTSCLHGLYRDNFNFTLRSSWSCIAWEWFYLRQTFLHLVYLFSFTVEQNWKDIVMKYTWQKIIFHVKFKPMLVSNLTSYVLHYCMSVVQLAKCCIFSVLIPFLSNSKCGCKPIVQEI
jgi:hypothetical protein